MVEYPATTQALTCSTLWKYSTILLDELTSWLVDSVIFSFLAVRFCATLRVSLAAREG
jgi:hypothetical protein